MERLNMWIEEHQISPEVKETMLREYGYLLFMGGLFINVERKYIIFSILQTATYISVNVVFSSLILITGLKISSLASFSQYMNYFSLGVIELGIYMGGLTQRKCVVRLLEIMSFDFYDYGDTFHNPEQETWKKELKRFKIIILVCIPVYLAIIALSVMGREWIDTILGFETLDVDYVGVVYQRTPIPMWYPVAVTNNFVKIMFTLVQMLHAAVLAMVIGSADVMMLLLGQTVILQMRILCSAASQIEKRALNMYLIESNGFKPPEDKIEQTSDKLLQQCYKRAIKQIIEHHLIIQEFYDCYNTLAKWPAGFAVLNGSVMIAMSILAGFSSESDVPSTYINSGLLLVAEVLSMWLLCETGQQVSEWSEKLYNAMYEFNWIDIATSNKRMVMIMKEKAKQPLVMMAGGLTPINRDTFGTIINSAYSYVNLLRASDKKSSEQ